MRETGEKDHSRPSVHAPALPGPFFANVASQTLSLLEQGGTPHVFEPGASLFHEGDAASRFIVIVEGEVRVWRGSAEGAAITVHLLGPGDVPGCVAVFRRIPYPATATATGRVRVLSWPAERIPALMLQDPVLAANALAIVGGRNAEMLDRLTEVSTLDVEQRLARALMRLVDALPPAPDSGPAKVRVSRQGLAELTAATLHTVSRFISRWEADGIVAGGRGRVMVRDRARLARIAHPG